MRIYGGGIGMGTKKTVNLGEQQFERFIEENKFYVDKTDFIREWWESGSTVTLITRPRRFGKTLNMNMLKCFFSNQYAGRQDLFEGLSIFSNVSDSEKYRSLQGTFPLIFLSFAPIKSGDIEGIKTGIKQMIVDVYREYSDIMETGEFDDAERAFFQSVTDDMDDKKAIIAVKRLCGFLKRFYCSSVIVLLDEYDTPMQESWLAGTWDESVDFFRNFFNHTFKTNDALYRGLITGITRISKESIFSDLNNLDVITTTSDEYATAFGFTEEEVFQALDDVGLGGEKQEVKKWYDGFNFGDHTDIYNPWSIASFIRKKGKYNAYWSNTSGNGLVNALIQQGNKEIKKTMEDLVQGKSFEVQIDEQIAFERLKDNAEAVWSLLLATGYLKVQGTRMGGADDCDILYTLSITNAEVRQMFRNMVRGWFAGDTKEVYNEFIKAMLDDDVLMMNAFMNKVALRTFSSFDSGNHPSDESEPERFYHGFVLGMVVNLAGKYQVHSNRESGYGRYDVMLEPADPAGKAFIFEFKVMNPYLGEQNLEDTLKEAHRQIVEKQYETELVSRGFVPEQIRKYGFAFRGKECLIG